MAFEITELLIGKLRLLCCEETTVHQHIEELEEFQKILKGAEDHEPNNHAIEKWKNLLPDIYSLEDIVESLIYRTSLKSQEIFIKISIRNKIGRLRSKVKKLLPSHPNDAQFQAGTSSSNSPNVKQAPPSSELITGTEPISEDNAPATVIDPECSQTLPSFKRADSVRPPLRKLLSRNWSDAQFLPEDVDEDATIPKASDEILGEAVLEDPVNKLAQPVLSSSKLHGTEPISEDNAPATVIDPECSQNLPSFKRTDSVGPPPRKLLSRNWSEAQFLPADVDEDATISNASDEILGEAVLEDLVNKLAQPVLSSSKLQLLMLEADVSCSGKAILLWTVYNAETVRQHFNFRAWVNVSEVSEELQIVNAILEHCNNDKEGDREALLSRRQKLHDFLVWKRFLIVLYGVREGFLWDKLESIFPYSLNGSRVILAIPHTDVAKSFRKASDEWHQQHWVKSSGYLEEDSSIISAKAVMDKLTESILSPGKGPFLIWIVGVVGSGKTTLLWPMYNAEDVQLHFQCCAWVHVPESFKERDLLTDIWEQVTGVKTEKLLPLKLLQQRLRSFLADKRYLVVLYDVWTAEIWEYIKVSLPNSSNDSRVVLAVQKVDVAWKTNSWISRITSGTEPVHNLKDMQENASKQKHVKRWENLPDITDEASAIVGLGDKLRELAELVLNSNNLYFLVSVLGVAGSGKTTLVRTFYNSIASKQHFECRAWISVPQDFEERDILLDLFRQLRKDKENRSLSTEQLRKGLSLFLAWKRYLIVLDDVRTPDIWNTLNLVFPKSANGSRVILTIRKAYLAYHMNPRAVVLSLRPLNKDESWKLFTEKVKTSGKNIAAISLFLSNIPDDLKEKILQRCSGIPLTIVVLGGLLSPKIEVQDYTECSNVINQTSKRGEKKKGVTGKDVDRVPSLLDTMHEKNKVKMVNQLGSSTGKENSMVNQLGSSTGKENSIEDQPSHLVQEAPSDDKKKLTENTTTMEDQLSSQNQSALLPTEQKEQSKVVTDNATSGEDQSTSSDELISPDEISLSNTLAVTYKHLSFPSKCCLLYLGLFPRLYEIPIRRLLQLWLAEGLVTQPTRETKRSKPLEELAKDCFEELLRTNMIEIAEVRLDGSPKTCCVTNTLYDTLLLNAEEFGFFHIHRRSHAYQSSQSNIRRLAEHLDMYIHTKSSEISIKHLRSYISFYKKKGDAPTSGVSELLQKIVKGGFESLVVLDLEGVYKPVLSAMVGKLRQLKYLGLRRTLLDSIPESVGGLPHLETLDIKQTYVVTLPSTIWKAKRLQHLHMSEIYFDVKKSTRGSLECLQTLWGLIIRRKLRETDWLVSLTGLRKLKLTCLEASMEDIVDWLTKLSNLQSLKLRSISDSNEPARLAIKAMRNLTILSRLYLLGELPNTFKVSDLPENLEVLTLSVSNLSEDPMEALGKLGKLKVLKLYAHSFKGQNMTCHRDGFPQLQVLKLWMLKELQSWTVEDKAMPILKEIEIRCCKNLQKVDGLENLTKLKELTLTNMKPSFIEYAREKVGDKVIDNVWKFPPPWEDTQARAES